MDVCVYIYIYIYIYIYTFCIFAMFGLAQQGCKKKAFFDTQHHKKAGHKKAGTTGNIKKGNQRATGSRGEAGVKLG